MRIQTIKYIDPATQITSLINPTNTKHFRIRFSSMATSSLTRCLIWSLLIREMFIIRYLFQSLKWVRKLRIKDRDSQIRYNSRGIFRRYFRVEIVIETICIIIKYPPNLSTKDQANVQNVIYSNQILFLVDTKIQFKRNKIIWCQKLSETTPNKMNSNQKKSCLGIWAHWIDMFCVPIKVRDTFKHKNHNRNSKVR